jgi:hypothetical protein
VKVRQFEVQSVDPDSSSSNKSDKFGNKIGKVLENEYSDVKIKNVTICGLFFFRCRKGSQLTYYFQTDFFHSVEIDHNNKNDTNVKRCNSKLWQISKILLNSFAPNDLPNLCSRASNNPVYFIALYRLSRTLIYYKPHAFIPLLYATVCLNTIRFIV